MGVNLVLATLPHILVGSIIAIFTLVKDNDFFKKKLFILLFSSLVVISPDILKIMGILSSHSLWLVPILGLIFSFIYVQLNNDNKLSKVWLVFSLIILFGHLLLDFIDNGVELFYPFIKDDFDYTLINKIDLLFIVILITSFTLLFFYKKKTIIVITSLSIIGLYLGALIFSKMHLEYTLKKEFKDQDIVLLITYPDHHFNWEFQVRTKRSIVTGKSPMNKTNIKIETRTEF
ncbi:metal-dependent hydrolase [Anoxybacillus flavithermus]|uniref:Uncharacterized transmembrane protein n=1 Tax=Anoxybacillus flavithermus (strain DSM 21510 / WK1) TaxID=491915 RepID=B7GIZ1_ANOFW|nr:metal-dependent hydrolase [Anoxybacillus flavithermus]ACJ32537.1 Uncharacterized transmembrane protein [Anoxybacillus flavithermus WK1]